MYKNLLGIVLTFYLKFSVNELLLSDLVIYGVINQETAIIGEKIKLHEMKNKTKKISIPTRVF